MCLAQARVLPYTPAMDDDHDYSWGGGGEGDCTNESGRVVPDLWEDSSRRMQYTRAVYT